MPRGDVQVSTDQCIIHRGHIIFNQAHHISYPFLTDKQNLIWLEQLTWGKQKIPHQSFTPQNILRYHLLFLFISLKIIKEVCTFRSQMLIIMWERLIKFTYYCLSVVICALGHFEPGMPGTDPQRFPLFYGKRSDFFIMNIILKVDWVWSSGCIFNNCTKSLQVEILLHIQHTTWKLTLMK